MLCELESAEEASTSSDEKFKSFWRNIWQLRVPNKVKIFLWRACTDALPTKVNLQKRKVVDNSVCNLCQKASEDTFHAVWGCDTVQSVWQPSFAWLQNQNNQLKTISDLVGIVLSGSARLDVFAMVAWSVWCYRNKIRCNEQTVPVNRVFDTTVVILTEFQQKFPGHGPKLKQSPARWKPPATGELKANFDGAVFVDTGEAGIGVVIQNEFGEVMATLSEKIALPPSVETLELLAARRAAVFAVELGLQKISFEGDAEGVIKALLQRDVTHSPVGHLLKTSGL